MFSQALPREILNPEIIEYLRELEAHYTQRIKELETNYQTQVNEYLILKEKYDLLIYKRFARSAEQLLEDKKQPLLFTEKREMPEENEGKEEELHTVKSFNRKKAGRKPLSANLVRKERIIDIGESEKTCACGADLTRIGEEISD